MGKKNKEKKEDNLLTWIFTNPLFWIISIAWGVWSGLEDLRTYGFNGGFLGTLAASMFIVAIGFAIIYAIKSYISNKVKKEIKDKLNSPHK